MKKAFAIALSAVLAIGVTACGGGQTTTREDTNAPAAAAAAADGIRHVRKHGTSEVRSLQEWHKSIQ